MEKHTILSILLVSITLCIVYCFPDCKPKEIKHNLDEPWKLDPFKYVNFMYGYSPDFLGGLIGTVLMEEFPCKLDAESKACRFFIIPKYCHMDLKLRKNLTSTSDRAQCPPPFLKLTPKDVQREKSWMIKSAVTRQVGQYDTRRITNLERFFEQCIANCTGLKVIAGTKHCDLLSFVNLLSEGRKLGSNQLSWDMSAENVYGLYLYWLCSFAWSKLQQANTVDMGLLALCPNPCSLRRGVCSRVPDSLPAVHTSPVMYAISESNCIRLGTDLLKDSFECLCKPGYKWSHENKQCNKIDLCAEDTNLYNLGLLSEEERLCSTVGTLRCVALHSQPLKRPYNYELEEQYSRDLQLVSNHHCVCRPGYMGYRCHRLRDACIESETVGHPPGNSACRTFLGNKCKSVVGTNRYHCECLGRSKQNGSLPFANCYLQKAICDEIICRNRGSCVHSPDNSAFRCICTFGWYGDFCELRDVRVCHIPRTVNLMGGRASEVASSLCITRSAWHSWSVCSSTICAGPGWQRRERNCRIPVNKSTGFGECRGHHFELRPCDIGCLHPLQSFLPTAKLVVLFSIYLLGLQLAVGIVYLLLRFEMYSTRRAGDTTDESVSDSL
ncbi:hypothetical protein CSKR_108210 [Clonorchis sinensis]|nr:hypothetical protein CSKR_108210 [Clonorchis sinensis]